MRRRRSCPNASRVRSSAFHHTITAKVLIKEHLHFRIVPSNCRYEVDDVNLGLDHYEGQFDVVHCRLISSGIKDYYGVIRDAAACLRAGGAAEFMEFDFRLYTRQHIAVPTTQKEIWGNTTPPPDFPSAGFLNLAPRTTKSSRSGLMRPTSSPYIARWFAALGQASRKRGGHADAASLIHSWVSANPSYEDVQYRDFWLPYGPWMRGRPEYMALSQYDRFCTIGDLMREDIFVCVFPCGAVLTRVDSCCRNSSGQVDLFSSAQAFRSVL